MQDSAIKRVENWPSWHTLRSTEEEYEFKEKKGKEWIDNEGGKGWINYVMTAKCKLIQNCVINWDKRWVGRRSRVKLIEEEYELKGRGKRWIDSGEGKE